MYISGDLSCIKRSSIGQLDTDGPTALHHNMLNRCIDFQNGTLSLRGARHGITDSTHTTFGDPPCAGTALHLAKCMVQQDVSGARLIWAGKIADDALKSQHPLECLSLKPGIQVITKRTGQQGRQHLLRVRTQLSGDIPGRQQLHQVAPASTKIGRRLSRQFA